MEIHKVIFFNHLRENKQWLILNLKLTITGSGYSHSFFNGYKQVHFKPIYKGFILIKILTCDRTPI